MSAGAGTPTLPPHTRGFLRDIDGPETIDSTDQDAIDPFGGQTNTLYFQYNPDKIQRGVAVTWAGQVVPGWSNRRLQFGGGGARTWKFKLQWYLDDPDDTWVARQCLWLESMTLAKFGADGVLKNSPHRLLFSFGQLTGLYYNAFKSPMAISGRVGASGALTAVPVVLTSLSIEYGPLFKPDSLLPIQAEADITVEEYANRSLQFRRVAP